MEPRIAFLSGGRLFVKDPGQDAREIVSRFAQESEERQARSAAVDGWKSRSGVWGQMGMAPPEWSQWENAQPRRRVAIRGVSRGSHRDELYYVLDLGDVHGLFRYDLAKGVELRLMHRNAFPALSLAVHPEGTMVVALRRQDGTAALAFSKHEGRHWNEVKGGDSVDDSPAWIPGTARVVFQSAAIGRDQNGIYHGLAPYAIESLDTAGDGQFRTLVSSADADHLLPRALADGTLYFVRRPYQPRHRQAPSVLTLLKDIVCFPYRLLRAIFHFLNFMSVMFSGKPLATAIGPQAKPDVQPFLMLWGHMVDTKRVLEQQPKTSAASLVPKDWVLVRRDANGTEAVLAESVVGYDLDAAGGIVFTNGTSIFHVDSQGQRTVIHSHPLIESVLVLG